MKKKVLWIILLLVLVVAIVVGIVIARKKDNTVTNTTTSFNKNTNTTEGTEKKESEETKTSKYERIELDDGVLYALKGKKLTADITLGDNYFDTTVNDMFLNPDSYYGKNIEIEGMYLTNRPTTMEGEILITDDSYYTFVGRYSTSNVCAYCPTGYSYFEYQFKGKIEETLTEEESWIKIIGKLKKGNDATSNFEDYYYISVENFEIMNERGQDTVNN